MKQAILKSILKSMLCVAIASSLFAAGTADARWCQWQPGYWAWGYWHPARMYCWRSGHHYYHGCRFIPGHYRSGVWIPRHNYCW